MPGLRSLKGYRPVAVVRFDPDGKILSANRQACALFGYTEEEFLALGDSDIDPLMTAGERAAYPRELQDDGTAKVSRQLRRKDGMLFPAWVVLHYEDAGADGSVTAFILDVSDEAKKAQTLREREDLLRRSQGASRLGSMKMDIASGTWVGSPELDKIFGIDDGYPRDIVGWSALVAADQREELLSHLERDVISRGGRFDREYRIVRPSDGEERWVHVRGELECDPPGNPVRLIGTCQDITERKRAEKEKEGLEERLRQTLKMETVARLAGGVAHEFNNMLTVILGHAELLRGRIPEGDPGRASLEEIAKAGARVRSITAQLLAFSRKQYVSPKPVNLNDRLAATSRTLARLVGGKIRIEYFPWKGLWDVRIDPGQLDQVLVNLVLNARDAMPEGGRLTIGTANVRLHAGYRGSGFSISPGDYVRLTVADEGVGMDRETVSHLFEPFYSTKEVGKGTGLGLASVYGIVKQGGGFIEIDSTPGKGTTVRIHFPRLEADRPDAERQPARDAVPVAAGESVLLVEDEEMVRGVVERQLESLGYRVTCAAGPSAALELFGNPEFAVDLLVTDVVMEEMSGVELWRKVRSLRRGTRVLFITVHPRGEIADRGILLRGERVLDKPFTRAQLSDAVREAISGP